MLVKGSEHKWFQISLHIKDKHGPQIDGRVPKDLKIAKLVFARYLPVSVQTQASIHMPIIYKGLMFLSPSCVEI